MIELLDASVEEVLAGSAGMLRAHGGGTAEQLVDPLDRVAASRQRRSGDARRVLAGRVAVRLLAAHRLGHDVTECARITVRRDCTDCGAPHGRPRVTGLSVSSSTSGDRVLAAVGSEESGVGVDVERIPAALFADFDEFALHPLERRRLAAHPTALEARIGIWVQKEAVLKSAGLGLRSPMDALLVNDGCTAGAPGGWQQVAQGAHPDLIHRVVRSLDRSFGYRGAVSATTPQEIRAMHLDGTRA